MTGSRTESRPSARTYRVVALAPATPDIRIVRLESESGERFRFRAGQHATLTFGALPPRDYSIASRPDESGLEFHIGHSGGDGVSAYVARQLNLGDIVEVAWPYGGSWLRDRHRGPMLAVAGGSGLAPVKSIVETALRMSLSQDIHLYFGTRDEPGVYLEPHFQGLAGAHGNFHYVPVLSEPRAPTARRTGLVSDAVGADFRDLAGFKAYVAGPPRMVEATTGILLARGMPAADIHADPFVRMDQKHGAGRR